MIRFHLDENVAYAVAHGLRLRVIDVTTTSDSELTGAADRNHIAYALANQRAVFTQDEDFLRHHRCQNRTCWNCLFATSVVDERLSGLEHNDRAARILLDWRTDRTALS